jgi:hypothetical protein
LSAGGPGISLIAFRLWAKTVETWSRIFGGTAKNIDIESTTLFSYQEKNAIELRPLQN